MSTCRVKIPHTPMMQRMLKTAEPTIVPTPTSPLVINTPAQRSQGGEMFKCERYSFSKAGGVWISQMFTND